MTSIWKGDSLDFFEGQLILIDKPLGWSSFDVVKKIRYAIGRKLDVKKIKVGHAGTLDPLATGLLIICTGRFTKKIDELMGQEKHYLGTIKVGATTPSYDLESEIDQTFETEHINADLISSAAKALTGSIDQLPPIFSAKKINGVRAYKLARKGEEVELKSRTVEVSEFQVDGTLFPELTFNVKCSKGTYIRSLAHDFGKHLNSGAHLTALRREGIGAFNVQNSYTIEAFISALNEIE